MQILFTVVLALAFAISAEAKYMIGVNYGQLGDNLPSAKHAVSRIKSLRIGHVKIYDANSSILQALAGTKITVAVMITDQEISEIAASQRTADLWVKHNVSTYYPETRIRTILVGNEILSDPNQRQTWFQIVPAMEKIRSALLKYKLHPKIKVSTPLAMDVLQGSIFPPSNATFRDNVRELVMRPMLSYLQRTHSPLFIDAYPYFAWENDAKNVSLDFALFGSNNRGYTDSGNGLRYTNLLDVQLDAVFGAMADLGYDAVNITLSETGWPTRQDVDERGANIHNAALYNRRLVTKMLAKPPHGTPRRPARFIRTFIFALFNEDLKPGPTSERNWGLLYPIQNHNQSLPLVYPIDFTGRLPQSAYPPLPAPPPQPPVGSLHIWCVANPNASLPNLLAGLHYACAQSPSICAAIQPGQPCFNPNSTLSHASYAFNNYYVQFKVLGGSCSFSGGANLTFTDPSYGLCKYRPLVF